MSLETFCKLIYQFNVFTKQTETARLVRNLNEVSGKLRFQPLALGRSLTNQYTCDEFHLT